MKRERERETVISKLAHVIINHQFLLFVGQKVLQLFVIKLQTRHSYSVLSGLGRFQGTEDVSYSAWDNTCILRHLPSTGDIHISLHGVCFARGCLSVCKHSAVVTCQDFLDNGSDCVIVQLLLSAGGVVYVVERECFTAILRTNALCVDQCLLEMQWMLRDTEMVIASMVTERERERNTRRHTETPAKEVTTYIGEIYERISKRSVLLCSGMHRVPGDIMRLLI